ncbi:hypothetical protein Leryth_015692 [Lithospermum erythrorhizon]|nr:hypothetical protein Leryth_015692 [Lithospermum erythrorhizon]
MEQFVGGGSGNWTMIPNSNPPTPSNNQDSSNLFLSPQQHHHPQRFHNHHQSLASHFHILHLVENLADVVENGTRDQQSDALVSELSNQFEKCQQLLKSIAGSISSKSMTVEQQKRILEEDERLLAERRDDFNVYFIKNIMLPLIEMNVVYAGILSQSIEVQLMKLLPRNLNSQMLRGLGEILSEVLNEDRRYISVIAFHFSRLLHSAVGGTWGSQFYVAMLCIM